MKLKKLLSVILAAVLLLGCMSITAFAAGSVFYLDEAGETKTADCAEINSTTTDWSGWMTVDGNVTIGGSITLTDDTNLILQDGANLKVGAIEGGKTLTVYAQSTGNNAGMLSVNPSDSGSSSQCITGNLTVHGGIVDISAEGSTVYGIKNGSLTVTGGNVYMALTGSMSCYAVYAKQISGNAVTVTGGSVAINLSGRSCHGIYASRITGDCLNISGGQVKVDMTALDGSAYGVYSSDSTGDTLNISGGKFVFDGVGSSVMGVYGSRITGNGLVVSGGEVDISVTASGTGSAVYSNVSIEDYYGIKHTGGTVNLHSNFSAASVRNISVLATEVSSDGENYSEWDGVTDPSEYHHLRFAAPEEPEDPSGVDLSMLTTGAKIQLGTQEGDPVEWVIGGDGETGMSVPTGCIALVSSDIVLSGVKFIANPDDGNAYATSNLRTVVEGAVTFTDDEQAVIQERTLAGNQSYGDTCDGVAGDSVIATVWAPTTKDAGALYSVHLSEVSEERCIYWLCSPGYRDDFAAIVIDGEYEAMGKSVGSECGVRAALYLDLSKVYGAEAVEGKENTYTLVLTAPSTFLTSFTLSKDYDDKYSTGNKTTAVTDTVTFTITPVVSGDPAFETVTVNVASGEGSADVTLPEYTKAGEYWYTITETAGTTAGVTYNTDTYYLHVIVDYEDGVYGVRSAQIHLTGSSDYDPDDASDKITTVSNSYGEGKLTVTQNVTFNGGESTDNTAEFVETVTFTLPAGTVITGNVTYGEGDDEVTITPEQWTDGSVSVDITLKNGASVTFSGLPDGATYTVEQKTAAESYGLESVEFNDPDTGDTVNNNVASGTIGDAADSVTVTNAGFSPLDVGVILESGAFILLALGAIAAGAWLIVSKRRRSLDAE